MWQDYLNLPEVQFLIQYGAAILFYLGGLSFIGWLASRRKR